jgi:hypothetical protein
MVAAGLVMFGYGRMDDLTDREAHHLAVSVKEVQRQFPALPAINPRWAAIGMLGIAFGRTYRPRLAQLAQQPSPAAAPAEAGTQPDTAAPATAPAGIAPVPQAEPWFNGTASPARH